MLFYRNWTSPISSSSFQRNEWTFIHSPVVLLLDAGCARAVVERHRSTRESIRPSFTLLAAPAAAPVFMWLWHWLWLWQLARAHFPAWLGRPLLKRTGTAELWLLFILFHTSSTCMHKSAMTLSFFRLLLYVVWHFSSCLNLYSILSCKLCLAC